MTDVHAHAGQVELPSCPVCLEKLDESAGIVTTVSLAPPCCSSPHLILVCAQMGHGTGLSDVRAICTCCTPSETGR